MLCKSYSSIKSAGFALLKVEQLQLITFCMKTEVYTLIEQLLQNKNPNRQIAQSCISSLEGIIKHYM